MQQIAVFYNPHASNTDSDLWIKKVKEILFRSEIDFYSIQTPAQLKRDIRRLVDDGVHIIVCIGGDGSVNLMIQELANKDVSFLIIPAGTANDLATELGIVKKITEGISAIRTNNCRSIDLIEVNGRYFATTGGFGIGGNVTEYINTIRKKVTSFRYLLKLLKHKVYTTFLVYETLRPGMNYHEVEIKSDTWSGVVSTPFAFVNNQAKVAGDVEVARGNTNDDGIFNVICFTHPKKMDLIKCFLRILSGDIPEDDEHFLNFETDKVSFECLDGTKMNFFGDGENFGEFDRLDVQLHPLALNVYTNEEICFDEQ